MSPFRLEEQAAGEPRSVGLLGLLACRVSCFSDGIGLVSGQMSLRRVQ